MISNKLGVFDEAQVFLGLVRRSDRAVFHLVRCRGHVGQTENFGHCRRVRHPEPRIDRGTLWGGHDRVLLQVGKSLEVGNAHRLQLPPA